jgi:hypothetical protein
VISVKEVSADSWDKETHRHSGKMLDLPERGRSPMLLKPIIRVTMISAVLATTACGTGPGTISGNSGDELAYNDPSQITPDYSARGAPGAISFGIGLLF